MGWRSKHLDVDVGARGGSKETPLPDYPERHRVDGVGVADEGFADSSAGGWVPQPHSFVGAGGGQHGPSVDGPERHRVDRAGVASAGYDQSVIVSELGSD